MNPSLASRSSRLPPVASPAGSARVPVVVPRWVARASVLAAASLIAVLTVMLPLGRQAVAASDGAVNACGCGRDTTGACFCQKVARCGCPGECEPKGCEDKRAKQLEKEIEAETKRAAEEDRKRNAPRPAPAADPDSEDGDDDAKSKAEPRSGAQAAGASRPVKATEKKKLTPAQKRRLTQLLDAYLAAYPDRRSRTAEQIRDDLD